MRSSEFFVIFVVCFLRSNVRRQQEGARLGASEACQLQSACAYNPFSLRHEVINLCIIEVIPLVIVVLLLVLRRRMARGQSGGQQDLETHTHTHAQATTSPHNEDEGEDVYRGREETMTGDRFPQGSWRRAPMERHRL